jgi:Tol biopolymer transport system component
LKIQVYIFVALFVFIGCRKSDALRSSNGLEKWQITTLAGYDGQPAISHDGRYVAHSSTQAGDPHIWVYDFNEQARTPLTANEGRDEFPCFSSDDRWIVFSSVLDNQSDLWLVSDDGDLVAVTKSSDRNEWAPVFADNDSSILCVFHDSIGYGLAHINRMNVSEYSILYRDSARLDRPSVYRDVVYFQREFSDRHDIVRWDRNTSTLSTVIQSDADAVDPAVSPDGQWLAYAVRPANQTFYQVYLMNLSDSRRIPVAPESEDQRYPAWTSDGEGLLYEGRSRWQIKRIDVTTQQDSIVVQSEGHVAQPVMCPGEKLIFIESSNGRNALYQMDLSDGKVVELSTNGVDPDHPDVSPDGRILALTGRHDQKRDIHLLPLGSARGELVRLTDDGSSFRPRFSRDGKKIFYTSAANGSEDVWELDIASKASRVLTVDDKNENDPSEGAGGFVVFAADWANRWSIWQMPVGGGMPLPLTRDKTPYGWDREPSMSGDGTSLLFTRSWYDDADVWLMRTEGGEKSTRTLTKDNTNQETHGRWSMDGQYVYFQSGNNVDIWMINIEPLINRD